MKALKLEDQLCFPIYALSRQVISLYRPYLDELDITYPQYLVLMLLWEHDSLSVKELGERLMLDSGTLTPLLKRLEQKGFVTRERSKEDERIVIAAITKKGGELKNKLANMPKHIAEGMCMTVPEMIAMRVQLEALILKMKEKEAMK